MHQFAVPISVADLRSRQTLAAGLRCSFLLFRLMISLATGPSDPGESGLVGSPIEFRSGRDLRSQPSDRTALIDKLVQSCSTSTSISD